MQAVKYPSIISEMVARSSRFFESCQISLRINRMKENRGAFNYIQHAITKSQTILCIGPQPKEHLFLLRKVAGSSGELIVFAPETNAFDLLQQLVQRMEWMNVIIELQLPYNSKRTMINTDYAKRNITKGATVIYINKRQSYKDNADTLDAYCACRRIKPDFIKINLNADQLEVLQGAEEVLKKYKPKVMIECEERLAGRRKIIETFEFLKLLDYKGFFILDSIRLPLQNFDFDMYQNPRTNFYCNTFIFE